MSAVKLCESLENLFFGNLDALSQPKVLSSDSSLDQTVNKPLKTLPLFKSTSEGAVQEVDDEDTIPYNKKHHSESSLSEMLALDSCDCVQCKVQRIFDSAKEKPKERTEQSPVALSKVALNKVALMERLKLRRGLNRLVQKAWKGNFDFDCSLPGDLTKKYALKYRVVE